MSSRDPVNTTVNLAPRAGLFGASAAMVTPFAPDGSVDPGRAAAHAAGIIADGADGVTLFGTTGEGASLGSDDRTRLLDALLDAGVPADRMTSGIAACDLESAKAQARLALDRGVSTLLLAPPFYFKDIDDDALFEWVSGFLQSVADDGSRVILYHIPQVTGVRFDAPLVRRLKDRFGAAIFGVKDSAGDWDHIAELLKMDDLAVLVGDERLLARAAPLGGAGAISGMANIVPARIARLVHTGRPDPDMDALVDQVVQAPVTPLIKALVGKIFDDDTWGRTRPPLTPADPEVASRLAARCMILRNSG